MAGGNCVWIESRAVLESWITKGREMEGRRSEEPGLYMPPNDVWTELGTRKTDIQDLASDTDKKSSIYMALGQTRVDWGLYKPFAHTWTMTTNSHQIWGYSHFHNEVTCISLKIFSAHIHSSEPHMATQQSFTELQGFDGLRWMQLYHLNRNGHPSVFSSLFFTYSKNLWRLKIASSGNISSQLLYCI